MATIYRFIVENKVKESGGRKSSGDSGYSKKTTAKKGKWVSLFGGEKGGVEHNRKMRAINPLMNKMTAPAIIMITPTNARYFHGSRTISRTQYSSPVLTRYMSSPMPLDRGWFT